VPIGAFLIITGLAWPWPHGHVPIPGCFLTCTCAADGKLLANTYFAACANETGTTDRGLISLSSNIARHPTCKTWPLM